MWEEGKIEGAVEGKANTDTPWTQGNMQIHEIQAPELIEWMALRDWVNREDHP